MQASSRFLCCFLSKQLYKSSHFHIGLALDLPLLQWLQNYTFPAESRFSDASYARRVYESCVGMTLAGGTTTANYMATIHRDQG